MTHTTTTQKAQGAWDSKGLHTDTNGADFRTDGAIKQAPDGNATTTKFIAAYARIKRAAGCFYLDLGIGLDAIAMLILVAVFVTVRALQ